MPKKSQPLIPEIIEISKETALKKFEITPQEVEKMIEKFKDLKVVPGDLDSLKAVQDAKMTLVHTRTAVEKRIKDLNASAKAFMDTVRGAGKQLLEPMAPLEDRFKREVDEERMRLENIKAEKERQEHKRVEEIREKIDHIRLLILETQNKNSEAIQQIIEDTKNFRADKETFQEFVNEAEQALGTTLAALQRALEAQQKFEAEEAKRKEEEDRLKKEREDLDRREAEVAEKEKALEEAEKKGQDEIETKSEELVQADKGAVIEVSKEDWDKSFEKDKENLTDFANWLQDGKFYPELETSKMNEILKVARVQIYDIGEEILSEIETL